MTGNVPATIQALSDFRRARHRAVLELIVSRLTGRPADLLCYDEVRSRLGAYGELPRGVRDIPLDSIVGSVGRCSDFTRSFFPRRDSLEARWVRVGVAVTDQAGVPPIEVYQIGSAYFVHDGNHRVSVARQLGAPSIQAYVTEVHTRVPLTPEDDPDDIIIKAEFAHFLDRTGLDRICPGLDLMVSVPGQYRLLDEHIAVHRYYMGLEQQRAIPFAEAVLHWCEMVYRPVVEVIREHGLLRDFPGRTETDLYLWLTEHRDELQDELQWEVDLSEAAVHLAAESGDRSGPAASRLANRETNGTAPGALEAGESPESRGEPRAGGVVAAPLFRDILVALRGDEDGWEALDQAICAAQRESSRLRGLHVVADEEEVEGSEVAGIRSRFRARCEQAGVRGELAVQAGKVASQVCSASVWADLLVVRLAHPPGAGVIARLGPGFGTLIRRCPRPILAVPGPASPLERPLLAYDDSLKAREALYLAAYLVGQWGATLTVVAAAEKGRSGAQSLESARSYLRVRGIGPPQVRFEERPGPAAEAILGAAEEHGADWLLIGGYGQGPVVEAVLGSTVDRVLRESSRPILICR